MLHFVVCWLLSCEPLGALGTAEYISGLDELLRLVWTLVSPSEGNKKEISPPCGRHSTPHAPPSHLPVNFVLASVPAGPLQLAHALCCCLLICVYAPDLEHPVRAVTIVGHVVIIKRPSVPILRWAACACSMHGSKGQLPRDRAREPYPVFASAPSSAAHLWLL